MNEVVARFQDGRTLKGRTNDFMPAKDRFHLAVEASAPGTKPLEILVAELKGLFFVKTFEGHPDHKKTNAFDPRNTPLGRKVTVVFKDGEELTGVTQGYQPNKPGFFIIPADAASNNSRCFIVTAAAKEIRLL